VISHHLWYSSDDEVNEKYNLGIQLNQWVPGPNHPERSAALADMWLAHSSLEEAYIVV
jgi:hypothetical protein